MYTFNGYSSKYALVDAFTRAIWLVLPSEQIAHTIKETFSGKLSLLVFDIGTFENVDLDNTVCLDWQVPEITDWLIVRPNPTVENNLTTYTANNTVSHRLINISAIAHPDYLKLELHHQLMFAYIIFKLESTPESVKQIFATQLTITDIERELYNVATVGVTSHKCPMARILAVLGRLYD